MLAPPRPPSNTELEALIKEARARQLRRRLLGAAGVAIVSAIALAGYALTIGGDLPGSSAAANVPASVPLCQSAQLSASAEFNGAAGSIFGAVMLFNTSGSACSLPRKRPVVGVSAHGPQPPITESGVQLNPNAFPLQKHGAMAEVYVEWFNWCGRTPTAMTLRFGPGLQVTAPLVDTQPPCSDELHPSAPSTFAVSRPLTPS